MNNGIIHTPSNGESGRRGFKGVLERWLGCIFRSADISTGALMFWHSAPLISFYHPHPHPQLHPHLHRGIRWVIPVTSIKMGAYVQPGFRGKRFSHTQKNWWAMRISPVSVINEFFLFFGQSKIKKYINMYICTEIQRGGNLWSSISFNWFISSEKGWKHLPASPG